MKLDFANLVAQLAVRFHEREALVNIERDRRYSFPELHALTNRIVNMMRGKLGLTRGDRYLCLLENDNLSLFHVWTALKGDSGVVWTNFRDSFDEHCWQIDFIQPKAVFIETALLERYLPFLEERGIRVVCMDPPAEPIDGVDCFWDLLDGVSDENPGVVVEAMEDVLIYRFTGGTTGRSKCAQYTMDNWMACRDSFYFPGEQIYDADTRYLHMAPISHGSGLVILACLFRGGCTVTQNVPDLAIWCRNVEAERITASLLLPTMIYRLLDSPAAAQHDLSTLRTIAYGGSPMSPAKLRLGQQRFGNVFYQQYGATECLQAVSTLSKEDHLKAGEHQLASTGRITGALEVRVVDDDGNDVPPGEVGEFWLRGRATISGYYNNPEGTASEFADGYWKSGDLGYFDADGYLYLVDRKKDMIITGGFNVYAVEVEAALGSHPAVENSCVVGIPHEEWGEAVHAEVILRPGCAAQEAELVDHVKERLGRFKAPKTVSFVKALPLSVVGKVVRRQVRESYWKDQARRVG